MQRGDALFLIGKRFGVTVDQIKQANGLGSDLIRAGQTLKIPPPAPRPQRPPAGADIVAPNSKADKPARQETEAELNHVRLQVFLDREQFSSGPITGKPTATFAKVKFLYQSNRADAKDDAALEEKAKAAVGEVFAQIRTQARGLPIHCPAKSGNGQFRENITLQDRDEHASFRLSRPEQISRRLRAAYRESDARVSQSVGIRRGTVSLQRDVSAGTE